MGHEAGQLGGPAGALTLFFEPPYRTVLKIYIPGCEKRGAMKLTAFGVPCLCLQTVSVPFVSVPNQYEVRQCLAIVFMAPYEKCGPSLGVEVFSM